MNSTRRMALAAMLGSGLALTAGCFDETAEPGDNDDRDDRDDSTDGEHLSTQREMTIESIDDNLDSLSFEIEVNETQLTPEKFPTLQITVTNTGDELASWTYGGSTRYLPFPQGISSDPGGLVIGVESSVEGQLMDPDEGCARVESFGRDDSIVEAHLNPGESFEGTYGIAGTESSLDGVCPDEGTYRFEFSYDYDGDTSDDDDGLWGFEIELAQV